MEKIRGPIEENDDGPSRWAEKYPEISRLVKGGSDNSPITEILKNGDSTFREMNTMIEEARATGITDEELPNYIYSITYSGTYDFVPAATD